MILYQEKVNDKLYSLEDISDSDWKYNYVVLVRVPMNNLPGCNLFFNQEVYRCTNKTKKLKSYFPSLSTNDWKRF